VSPAIKLLARLDRVKQTAPGRWVASCPSHPDRSPSLSIRELEDGRILLYDFGGCETGAILAAVGLHMSDLFERALGQSLPQSHAGVPARDRLEIIDREVTVAALIVQDVLNERSADESQWKRLAEACARIGRARDYGRA
jgi:hypothetical protein